MNFKDIFNTIKGPLLSVAASFIPGGPAILAAVNGALPENKQLPDTATGGDIQRAVDSLPAPDRARLMEKELDVKIAEITSWTDIQESLAKADASGSSTRPQIALMMAWCVVIVISIFIGVWAIAIINKDVETLKTLANSWMTILAIISVPTALLRSYFGMRTKEKTARYNMANGKPIQNGFVELFNAIKGK